MKKTLTLFAFHWKKFAWSGTGAALATLGTQIDKPYATYCFVCAAVCAILAANDRPVYKTQQDRDRAQEEQ